MDDKEYTYDIDKYTIGVDENGENGIGLTISIIKNGEINFLGNCYGENARCIDLLIKENQELKKQLEVSNELVTQGTLTEMKLRNEVNSLRKEYQDTYKDVCIEIKEYKTQQKEFIKWLEDNIDKLREIIIDNQLENNRNHLNYLIYKRNLYTIILQKYKEIIGVSDENKRN